MGVRAGQRVLGIVAWVVKCFAAELSEMCDGSKEKYTAGGAYIVEWPLPLALTRKRSRL